ncbi:hypothetical protein B0H11DRAFT_2050815 [Mycena galericulata]|nr:hypothetical protein B0H11DRAFT_2050815 [Mycena galericulata]
MPLQTNPQRNFQPRILPDSNKRSTLEDRAGLPNSSTPRRYFSGELALIGSPFGGSAYTSCSGCEQLLFWLYIAGGLNKRYGSNNAPRASHNLQRTDAHRLTGRLKARTDAYEEMVSEMNDEFMPAVRVYASGALSPVTPRPQVNAIAKIDSVRRIIFVLPCRFRAEPASHVGLGINR